jgi:hypothetical protein
VSNTDVTAYIAGIGGLLTAIALVYGAVRSARKAASDSTVTARQQLSADYKSDRDQARGELATIDATYLARIAVLTADYEARLAALRAQNAKLIEQLGDRDAAP